MLLIARRVAVLASLVALLGSPALSQRPAAPDREAQAAAKDLMTVIGAAKQMDVMMANMLPHMATMFKQARPEHSREIDEVFAGIAKRFFERKQELIDLVAPIYASHFTAAEIKEVIAFFKSPIGAKFIAAQPTILQQSMLVGQQWGARIGAEIDAEARRELKKKGIEI